MIDMFNIGVLARYILQLEQKLKIDTSKMGLYPLIAMAKDLHIIFQTETFNWFIDSPPIDKLRDYWIADQIKKESFNYLRLATYRLYNTLKGILEVH